MENGQGYRGGADVLSRRRSVCCKANDKEYLVVWLDVAGGKLLYVCHEMRSDVWKIYNSSSQSDKGISKAISPAIDTARYGL